VEQEDHLRLFDAFQPGHQQQHLDRQRGEREEVVACQWRIARVPAPRRQQQGHHHPAEQAGRSLLEAEADEFMDEHRQPAVRSQTACQPSVKRSKAQQETGVGTHEDGPQRDAHHHGLASWRHGCVAMAVRGQSGNFKLDDII
jgi:hypothetical protein